MDMLKILSSAVDSFRIGGYGVVFGGQDLLNTFERARGKLHTLSEIYNSIETEISVGNRGAP